MMVKNGKTVVGCALGECVHVAGVMNFLRMAEQAGWHTVFLGPATPIQTAIKAAEEHHADLLAVSYRLTPETGERLLAQFAESADHLRERGVQFAFGGTPPVAERAEALGFFDAIFDGSQNYEEIMAFLKGEKVQAKSALDYPTTTVERILWKAPYPLLRHHFGLPSMEATIAGIQKIAEVRALDVISLGIDQDAQENFFHPERQDARRTGAGGVPVRTAQDYRDLYAASRRGNFPLLRTYSGTDDFIQLAEMYVESMHNAWAAIPLFWFNRMDGRGPWDVEGSIREHQKVMEWYGAHDIPVELNEPHHWGMRDAPDVIFVVSAYLAAYNARAFGVRNYIAQMMFNSPPGTSDAMDLAKMAALLEMGAELENENFTIWRQTRTGLLSYPLEPAAARAHLSASIYLQMSLHPHIVHIVGHTEAHHAATADDIIEACLMARRSIENALAGQPDMLQDPAIQHRKNHLMAEARLTLQAIHNLGSNSQGDPFTDPQNLTEAVRLGILDAPHLKNNPFAPGNIITRIINGSCEAIDGTGKIIAEKDRLAKFL
ncbi:cobalamin B12-binding domain-containing protein [Pelolinea submarina]|uniref:B12 binding protein n=1 Tax=Pelolinea submarina TaxID=913107 RepID=A0A3E0A6H9_9CHLR|nr:cobalamin B12-binding domain-containing protein [Pelolinea submarina]REG06295.1 B12 binding protein [Pelolinea submarina]